MNGIRKCFRYPDTVVVADERLASIPGIGIRESTRIEKAKADNPIRMYWGSCRDLEDKDCLYEFLLRSWNSKNVIVVKAIRRFLIYMWRFLSKFSLTTIWYVWKSGAAWFDVSVKRYLFVTVSLPEPNWFCPRKGCLEPALLLDYLCFGRKESLQFNLGSIALT